MRLYERLLAARGGETDQTMLGGITAFCKEMVKAQCFALSDDISFACSDVCKSKPTSILAAIDMIRAPYTHTWIEWTPDNRHHIRDNSNMFSHAKPKPKRLGALVITNDKCNRGFFLLTWWHNDDSIMVCPLGVIFDWDSAENEPVISQYLKSMYGEDKEWVKKTIKGRLSHIDNFGNIALPDKWEEYTRIPAERAAATKLTLRGEIVPIEMFFPFLQAFNIKPGAEWYESFVDDLAGELPFVEAFFLLLNSRNSIVRRDKENLAKLNNARRKNKKPPLREFINTSLRISKVVANRGASAGFSREAVRMHLVRGHFKVRKSGVYWWSPHPRGRERHLTRREYEVK